MWVKTLDDKVGPRRTTKTIHIWDCIFHHSYQERRVVASKIDSQKAILLPRVVSSYISSDETLRVEATDRMVAKESSDLMVSSGTGT